MSPNRSMRDFERDTDSVILRRAITAEARVKVLEEALRLAEWHFGFLAKQLRKTELAGLAPSLDEAAQDCARALSGSADQ